MNATQYLAQYAEVNHLNEIGPVVTPKQAKDNVRQLLVDWREEEEEYRVALESLDE